METYEVLDWMEKLDDGPRFTLVWRLFGGLPCSKGETA